MKAPLSPRNHGYIDYLAVGMLLLAPTLFRFSGLPAALCYVLAVFQGGMSLMTAYPLGLAKIIPFPLHGSIEAVTSVALVVLPFLLGFSEVVRARNFFIVSGIALFAVWMVTNYRAAELPTGGIGMRRRIHV